MKKQCQAIGAKLIEAAQLDMTWQAEPGVTAAYKYELSLVSQLPTNMGLSPPVSASLSDTCL